MLSRNIDIAKQPKFGEKDANDYIALMDDYDKKMISYIVELSKAYGRNVVNIDTFENVLEALKNLNAENEYEYLNSLLHPERCKGVKIPSPIPVPSCAFQLHNTVTLTTNPSGNLCFLFNPFFLYDRNILNEQFDITPNAAVNNDAQFQYLSSLYVNNFSQLDGFTPNVPGWQPINIGQGIPNVYNQYRLVSASLVVRYIGRMDITSGVIGGAIIYDESVYPGGKLTYTSNDNVITYNNMSPGIYKYTNFDLAMDSFYHQERNCIQGLREIYFPLDNTYEEYQKMASKPDFVQVKQQIVASNGETYGYTLAPSLCGVGKNGFQQMVYILGAPPSSACFKVDIYCNFETLPNAEFLNYMPISLSSHRVSPEIKKQSIAIVQQKPITDLKEKTPWYGDIKKGLVSGLKKVFKSGTVSRKLIDTIGEKLIPFYKPAVTLFNMFESITQGNSDNSFQKDNPNVTRMLNNAEKDDRMQTDIIEETVE